MTQQMYAHSFHQAKEENSKHLVGRCLPKIVKEDDFGLVGWVVKVGRGNGGYMGLKAAAKVQSNQETIQAKLQSLPGSSVSQLSRNHFLFPCTQQHPCMHLCDDVLLMHLLVFSFPFSVVKRSIVVQCTTKKKAPSTYSTTPDACFTTGCTQSPMARHATTRITLDKQYSMFGVLFLQICKILLDHCITRR